MLSPLRTRVTLIRSRCYNSFSVSYPRAVSLVAEKYQLAPSVPIKELSGLVIEVVAPIADHTLAQEAPLVLLAGPPAGLALEGELFGCCDRLLQT